MEQTLRLYVQFHCRLSSEALSDCHQDDWAEEVDATMSRIRQHPTQKSHSGSALFRELEALQKDMPLILMTATGRDRFRLICDPFFVQRPPPHKPEVHADRSYDLAYLGEKSKGTWAFLATLAGSDDDVELHLHQWCMNNMAQAWVRQRTIRMPLYSEGSCNCVTIGVDGRDLNDLIGELDLGLPPQPEEDPNDDPQDMSDYKEPRVASQQRVVSDIVNVESHSAVSAKKTTSKTKLLAPGPIRWRKEKESAKAKPYQRPQRTRAPSHKLSQ
jgi:hypothetical protein